VKVCPKKVNVSVKLDTAHSTSLTVASGTAGSEVTTSGSRGKVTLTLPGGATQSGVTIWITPTLTIADSSLAGGAVFATRDYNQTFDGGEETITEATHFVLRHTPR